MQLTAADQHGTDLRQLAELTRAAVRLGVHGQVLGAGHRELAQVHGAIQARAPDGAKPPLRCRARAGRSRPPPGLASLDAALPDGLQLLRVRPRVAEVARALSRLCGMEHAGRGDPRECGGRPAGARGLGRCGRWRSPTFRAGGRADGHRDRRASIACSAAVSCRDRWCCSVARPGIGKSTLTGAALGNLAAGGERSSTSPRGVGGAGEAARRAPG